jgi:hypothetical protein
LHHILASSATSQCPRFALPYIKIRRLFLISGALHDSITSRPIARDVLVMLPKEEYFHHHLHLKTKKVILISSMNFEHESTVCLFESFVLEFIRWLQVYLEGWG